MTNGAYVASGVLRRWGLPAPDLRRTPAAVQAGLWACAAVMRRAGLVKSRLTELERSFELGASPA